MNNELKNMTKAHIRSLLFVELRVIFSMPAQITADHHIGPANSALFA
jgi:hypothetical protein